MNPQNPAEDADQRDLCGKDDQQRKHDAGDLPQTKRHQRHDQEERQRHVADIVDDLLRQPEHTRGVIEVANRRRHQHGADVHGQCHVVLLEPRRDPRAHPQADAHRGDHDDEMLQQHVRLGIFAGRACDRRFAHPRLRQLLQRRIARRRRREAARLPLDQVCADRAANHAARDNADHGGRHREGGRAGHAGLLEEIRERKPGCRPPGQRHRPGKHPHQRVLSESHGHEPAEHVLQRGDDRGDDEKEQDARTAALEQRNARPKSNRCEERVLERRLQRRIHLQRLDAREVQHREDRRHRKAAAHRRRNVHARERRDQPAKPVADEENDAGECNGLNEVEGQQHARSIVG
jgi:hypothetical protein